MNIDEKGRCLQNTGVKARSNRQPTVATGLLNMSMPDLLLNQYSFMLIW